MPDPTPDHLDAVVRDHLSRQAAEVDPAVVLARVRAAMRPPSRPARLVAPLFVGGLAALAAGVLVAVLVVDRRPPVAAQPAPPSPPVTHPPPVVPSSPVALLTESRRTHSDGTDRRYTVTVDRPPARPGVVVPPLALFHDGTLWVRGDRFWFSTVTPDGRTVHAGRGADGNPWLAPGPFLGLRFAADEVTHPTVRALDQLGLRAARLSAELLDEYTLSTAPGPDDATARLRAVYRKGLAEFTAVSVEVDIDRASHALTRVVQQRRVGGDAVLTTTFTLAGADRLPDDKYELANYLRPAGRVLDAADRPGRDAALRGEPFDRWKK